MSKMHEKHTLMMTQEVGKATNPDTGNVYHLMNGFGTGTMLVRSELTGRTFSIDWQTAIQMAIEASVDLEPNVELMGSLDGSLPPDMGIKS